MVVQLPRTLAASIDAMNRTREAIVVRQLRHDNFVANIPVVTCAMVQTLPYHQRCDFVRQTSTCNSGVLVFNYVQLLYCDLNANAEWKMWLSVLLLMLICMYLFLVLATTADGYFCPSLSVLANLLGLSENVAGVTLVAFGNGASDMFTSLAGLQHQTREISSDIFGSATFVFLIVGGSVILTNPFKMQPALFIRDCCFFILDMLFVEYMTDSKKPLSLTASSLYLSLYFFYIVVVIIDQYLVIRTVKQIKKHKKIVKQTKKEKEFIKMEATVNPIAVSTARRGTLEKLAILRLQRFRRLAEATRIAKEVIDDTVDSATDNTQEFRDYAEGVDEVNNVIGQTVDLAIDISEEMHADSVIDNIELPRHTIIQLSSESSNESHLDESHTDALQTDTPTNLSDTESQQNMLETAGNSATNPPQPHETDEDNVVQSARVSKRSTVGSEQQPSYTTSAMSSVSEAGKGEAKEADKGVKPISIYAATLIMISRKLLQQPCDTLECLKRKNLMLPQPTTLCKQFWATMNPISEEFHKGGVVMRIFVLLKFPIELALTILIPVVNFEKPIYGWSKLLNCIQLVLLPSFIAFLIAGFQVKFYLPIFVWVIICTSPLALLVFFTTTVNKVPLHFKLFCILGVMGSMLIIYLCATEIINMLTVIGIATYCSSSFLGCTLLAWGNSVGDLITNTAMARQGYPKMGFSACIGGPLFSSIVVIGCGYIYKTVYTNNKEQDVGQGTMGVNSVLFLLVGVTIVLYAAIATDFRLRRSIGAFMITLYVMHVIFALLGELEVIHSFGSDHRLDLKADSAD